MPLIRTILTDPIRIDSLPLLGSTLGLTFCPGKKASSLNGPHWDRDLESDLDVTVAWGAELVVTLMEQHEFGLLGVSDLADKIANRQIDWLHLPIRDIDIPDAGFMQGWKDISASLQSRLRRGQMLIVHCRGGLGRTGLVAAMLLADAGFPADLAMAQVRRVRSGTVETRGQEAFVLGYHPRRIHQDDQRPEVSE